MEVLRRGSWFERHPRKTLFCIIFVSLFLVLTVVDILIAPPSKSVAIKQGISLGSRFIRLREIRPSLDSTVRPSAVHMNRADSLVEEEFLLRTDNNGFILPVGGHADPDISIVFLGGSTTECRFVKENKRFPYLAGKIMEQTSKLKINTYNGGVSGNHTLHSINTLINKVIPMNPQYVVLMHNINDLSTMLYEGTYWNNNARRGLIGTAEARRTMPVSVQRRNFDSFKDMLFPNIHKRLRSIWSVEEKRVSHEHEQGDEWANATFRRLEKKNFLLLYERSLYTFIDISKNWNIVPILMTQMNRIEADNMSPIISDLLKLKLKNLSIKLQDWIDVYESMQFVTRKVAREREVMLIDLDRRVPKNKKYIYDLVHLNTTGSEFVANIISQEVSIEQVQNVH